MRAKAPHFFRQLVLGRAIAIVVVVGSFSDNTRDVEEREMD
jgi:hypothetical protein